MNLDVRTMFRSSLGLFTMLGFLISGCSSSPEPRVDTVDKSAAVAVIESVRTETTPGQATVTFVCSRGTTYGKPFTLTNPTRVCFDIKGTPAKELPPQVQLKEGPVREILIQGREGGDAAVVAYMRYAVNQSRLVSSGNNVVLEVTGTVPEKEVAAAQPSPGVATDPDLPQILDVAVTQRRGNRTRLSVKTDRKVTYDVKLDGNTLLIDLKNGTIKPELMKKLDSEHAEGAVSRVKAFYSALDRHVSLRITLRTLIPYHIAQEGEALNIDFDPLPVELARVSETPAVKAPPKEPPKPVAVKEKAEPRQKAPVYRPAETDKGKPEKTRSDRAGLFEATSKQYAGQSMSFDFVDTDIRNILRLIAEVAGINIVWGSDVEGKISMKLDNIPWDQALEMILRPNGLTYQIEDDVLWVVPKAKLRDMEISEGKRKGAMMAAKRQQGIFEAKIIEFITIRHRKAADIFKMLVGDKDAKPPLPAALDIEAAESKETEEGEQEKGKEVKIATLDLYLSFDAGTNVIIANGVRAKVDKVKELIAKLDIPEKQIMIEARVVDARTTFSRDLGIQWQSLDGQNPGFRREWYNTGSNFSGLTQFSTNAPSGWTPNIGLAFGWLTDGGLGSIALDASLALGENDGKVHIISAPKVLTVNGGKAVISRGEVKYFPIKTLDTVDYKEIPAVLSLTVSPTVSADNSHITMAVKVTDNVATRGEVAEGQYTVPPGRTEKTIETTLIVRTGETVVIGGIYHKEESTFDSGVPWLKDIPLLGWLFKAQYDDMVKTELLIFLTPTVVDTVKKAES